ncbi:MAG: hypothetical protein Q8930_18325 [Bacillota bacterium]|nr:hypothetical protein [Bacillota bacterium]
MKKKYFSLILFLFLIPSMAACNLEAIKEPETKNSITQTQNNGTKNTDVAIETDNPEATPSTTSISTPFKSTTQVIDNGITQTPTVTKQNTTPILRGNTSPGNDLFAPIINAYAELEGSGYASFHKNIIGDSLLAVDKGSTYNFGWDKKPILMYSIYDINGDGSPELIIGADESISGIYALQNGTPVSVLQVESRHNLNLLMDSKAKCVIEDSWGHTGYATEFFYTINEVGKLVTLDKLYTNGDDKKDAANIGHFRAKDVLGKEVSITEEEYCSLIRKYGSTGYEPLKDIGKARMIDVIWESVATYNKQLKDAP